MILTVFSLSLVIGVFAGEAYIRGWFEKQDREFIWTGLRIPEDTHEALDWLLVEAKLKSIGYGKNQVRELYKTLTTDTTTNYFYFHNHSDPFHLMLSTNTKPDGNGLPMLAPSNNNRPKQNRGSASEGEIEGIEHYQKDTTDYKIP